MAFNIADRVRESTTSTGTGPITLLGAAGGYVRFGAVLGIGDTTWYSIVLPGSQWETGIGTYSALNTLTRTTILESSNPGGVCNFGVGTKDVFICQPAQKAQAFPSGTLMLFQQTAAPIYWTKQTTHDNKALRVVSGTASVGGTFSFNASFNSGYTTSNTTITQTTMASHQHTYTSPAAGVGTGTSPNYFDSSQTLGATGSIGGNGAHNHGFVIDVLYVDLIIAMKD